MESNYNKISLDIFFRHFNILAGKESSQTLGDHYLINPFDSCQNFKEEIEENGILMPIENYKAYLVFVAKKIKRDIINVIDSSFLIRWNKKYDFKKNNFSITDEFGVKLSLNKWGEFLNLNCFEDITIADRQKDVDLYAFYIEAIKIINDLLEPEIIKQQTEVPVEEITINDKSTSELEKTENPYPHIFINLEAYKLFEKLYDAFKIRPYKLANFSFIYRKMYEDELILDSFKPQMFINWIAKEPYNIDLDKIKTLANCVTINKIQTYNNIKELLGSK